MLSTPVHGSVAMQRAIVTRCPRAVAHLSNLLGHRPEDDTPIVAVPIHELI